MPLQHGFCRFQQTFFSAFQPAFLPAFFPADSNAFQLRVPQMRLIRHIGSPPIFAHFRRFYRFIQPVDQLQLALLHRILFWIVDIRQHFLQRLGNFSPRALCIEKQLIRFVLQFHFSILPAHIAEGIPIKRLAKRIECTDKNHVARPQFIVILPSLQLVDIDMRLIQPRALRQRDLFSRLHFDIVYRFPVIQIRVQPHAALACRAKQRLLRFQPGAQRLFQLLLFRFQLNILYALDGAIGQKLPQQSQAKFRVAHDIGKHEIVPNIDIVQALALPFSPAFLHNFTPPSLFYCYYTMPCAVWQCKARRWQPLPSRQRRVVLCP